MNVSPDQIRAATRTAAAVITADKMPPLRLDEPPVSHGFARRPRPAWVAPLAAAAAVVLVVGGVAAGSRLAGSGNGRSSHHAATRQAAPAGSFTDVPPYYVAVENSSSAVVRATATGAILARLTTRIPFVGVTGAADDRTFVLDAQRSVVGPTVQWPGHPAFYLLRLSASGTEESFTRLVLPALPAGAAVTGLALSPDGSKLAVEWGPSTNSRTGLLEIRVYTLATGASRTWSATGSGDSADEGGFTGSGVDGSQSISWSANAQTLAFDWINQSYTIGVRLLDTAASGDNLIADSRLAVIEARLTGQSHPISSGPPDYIAQCVTDSIMSPDGSSIVCGYSTSTGSYTDPYDTTGFIRYSAETGKQAQVFGVFTFQGHGRGGEFSLYWTDSTGKTLIGSSATRSGSRVGVINGETFTPLPGITSLTAAAW
jgi:hypothetical protein